MARLTISHVEKTMFQVVRPRDGKISKPREIPSPFGFPVKNRPQSDLMGELRWYLEDFLDYPFSPYTDRAESVLQALDQWGTAAFNALFDTRDNLFDGATSKGRYSQLALKIASDDPQVLGWPWEGLKDPQSGFLAQTCHIERRLGTLRDPVEPSPELPKDRLNVLMITCRPYKNDAHYRAISRPVIDLIDKLELPVHVDMVRPPTYEALLKHLDRRPDFYHMLHFDGHGGYQGGNGEADGFKLDHPTTGVLVFEDKKGGPDPIAAQSLSNLLREYRLPAVVLNACHSGKMFPAAKNPFGSVAAALLGAGIPNVVAMAYALYVSGAQEFLPSFYRKLLETGDIGQATRAGRRQMLAQPRRLSPRRKFPLNDWLVPVVYQQGDAGLLLHAPAPGKAVKPKPLILPAEVLELGGEFGFVGRDQAILKIERHLQRTTPACLIQGLAGVGKTTLAKGIAHWLVRTGGMERVFWFGFVDIQSAEYVINQLGDAFLGGHFGSQDLAARMTQLAARLKKVRCLIIWDNFEDVCGIANTSIAAKLSHEHQQVLHHFLKALRGGKTKVLITSRSEEKWLGIDRVILKIGGLAGEERWQYCERILTALGLSFDRDQEDFAKLMDFLAGHPLAMGAVLSKLEFHGPGDVLSRLKNNLESLGMGKDDPLGKLHATLQWVLASVPERLEPLLAPLSQHEGFLDGDYLLAMARQVDPEFVEGDIQDLLRQLKTAGLLQSIGQNIFVIHPALPGFLRQTGTEDEEVWVGAFVTVMAALADLVAPKALHEQRGLFQLHKANFHGASLQAERLGKHEELTFLIQALGVYALNTRNFSEAFDAYNQMAGICKKTGNSEREAGAYHQLGIIAQEQRDFGEAESWYKKSLQIKEKHGNEQGAARTYHQLGRIAEEQRDFGEAERWYKKSLTIVEKHGNEHGAAMTYHQLGIIAQEQRDFVEAESWYKKSLEIKEKQGNEHGAASTYHQLGRIAQEQRDFVEAESWYKKSLEIKEKQGNEHGAASTYHELGIIAQEQRDFVGAENWYKKSLAIKEKQGNEHGAAGSVHQLGKIAEKQGDLEQAARFYIRSLKVFARFQDNHNASIALNNFMRIRSGASSEQKELLETLWREAGLGNLPKEDQTG